MVDKKVQSLGQGKVFFFALSQKAFKIFDKSEELNKWAKIRNIVITQTLLQVKVDIIIFQIILAPLELYELKKKSKGAGMKNLKTIEEDELCEVIDRIIAGE